MDNPLIIFDCDGVLIDSEAIYIEAEMDYLARLDIKVDRAWYMREFMALAEDLARAKFSGLIEQKTGSPMSDEEYASYKKVIRTRVLNEVQTIEGIETLLHKLSAPRCVASTTVMEFLPKKLEKTDLARFFGDGVFSGEMVENGKPAPDLFLFAAEKMGHDPQKCIVIEDSPNGVRGAKAAGQFAIGFTGGSHVSDDHGEHLRELGADLVVDSHAALAQWLTDNTSAMN